ncbi:major facilitator superfamily domain-containing protein [Gilbertella persicaria]|uniref:major facilitator superfamily domain-containing protein n=1 Tax=Gilbertella persicaria TaxID=101096 RepID=UPI00221FAF0E|nr:major facilitator superfamily domain-containing protein [Gilbertella persicaria]KAI8066956.1 major facilitator superfamily domain-containing protein [Gilbertella persicaria]
MPYWTWLVDKTGEYKKVMIQNMLIALGCILSIAFVPFASDKEWIHIVLTSMGCFGYAFFGYPVIAVLVDAVILRVLADRKDLYGRQKIGVPIGFASSVFLTGFLTEKLDSLYALFIVFGFSCISFIVTVIFTNFDPPKYSMAKYGTTSLSPQEQIVIEDQDDDISVTKAKEGSMWHLLQTPESVQFFTFVVMLGSVIAAIQAFLYLFFENDLKGTSSMLGLFGPLGSSTEVICFFYSKQILLRLGSRRMLIVAQCITVYRCLTYFVATELTFGAWLTTTTQLLHGIGFSMAWSAGALQADLYAPPHLKSSAQGLLNMAFNGVSGLNVLVCGYIYETYGSRSMWAFVSTMGMFSLFLYQSVYLRSTLFSWISEFIKRKFIV